MRDRTTRPGLGFGAVAVASFALGPFLWAALSSFRPAAEVTVVGMPSRLTLENYAGVFQNHDFGRVLLNSLVVAGSTTALCLALGSSAAFALARIEFPGRRFILAFALTVSMFPPIATVSPLYLIIRALGLRDHLAGLILPYCTFALPLTLWMLTSFFRELPDELLRAARVDGCTAFGAFRKVFLPLAAPGLATTAILVFMFAWNEFLYALTFTSSPLKRTVPVAISLFATEHTEPWAEIAAASVIATLPLIIATVLFQRRIVAGLTAGAVKG
jgi:multiple sugar transport system permease protein